VQRTARLFAIAEALRARRTGVTAESLADTFGVSVRTMYRDLDSLREASLPVAAERGRGGGFALDRAYSLPPVNFTVREAMVLSVLGRLATQLRLFPFTRTLNSALDKVRAALPTAQQRKLEASRERLTFVGVPAHDSVAAVRAAIEDAWFEEQPIHLRYERKDQSRGERTVQIEAIVLERTETLLNTVDVSTGERRQLKLHQILAATPPKEPAPTASPTTKGSAAPATRGKGSSRRGR
jgi:predicted DNA-binding transcriptional regulator YafY